MRRLALAFYLGCLLAAAGCAPSREALDASAAVAATSVADVDRQGEIVDAQLVTDFRARADGCGLDDACIERAKAATKAALAERDRLAVAARAAAHRVADALEAADRCPTAACRSSEQARAAAAQAEVAALLVQLRATAPSSKEIPR